MVIICQECDEDFESYDDIVVCPNCGYEFPDEDEFFHDYEEYIEENEDF